MTSSLFRVVLSVSESELAARPCSILPVKRSPSSQIVAEGVFGAATRVPEPLSGEPRDTWQISRHGTCTDSHVSDFVSTCHDGNQRGTGQPPLVAVSGSRFWLRSGWMKTLTAIT